MSGPWDHVVVNWFPGHMAKASRELREKIKQVTTIIEVRDARIPLSSANDAIQDVVNSEKKNHIIIFNKDDLADPIQSKKWNKYLQKMDVFSNKSNQNPVGPHFLTKKTMFMTLGGTLAHKSWKKEQKIQFGRLLATTRINLNLSNKNKFKPAIAMAVGLPNVGKSTLINALIGKRGASVAAKPAWTRGMQIFRVELDGNKRVSNDRIKTTSREILKEPESISSEIELLDNNNNNRSQEKININSHIQDKTGHVWFVDTPGIMIPYRIDPEKGLKMALCNIIAENVLDDGKVLMADYLYYLLGGEKSISTSRDDWWIKLKLDSKPNTFPQLLELIKKRHGKKDEVSQASLFVNMFRSGKLGRFTLDTLPYQEKSTTIYDEESQSNI